MEITLKKLLKMIEDNHSFQGLHEDIAHEQGHITATDEAKHTRNLYRASLMRPDDKGACKIKYVPNKYKASCIEDEFAEFRTKDEKVVVY